MKKGHTNRAFRQGYPHVNKVMHLLYMPATHSKMQAGSGSKQPRTENRLSTPQGLPQALQRGFMNYRCPVRHPRYSLSRELCQILGIITNFKNPTRTAINNNCVFSPFLMKFDED